jgi:hypothetical protein
MFYYISFLYPIGINLYLSSQNELFGIGYECEKKFKENSHQAIHQGHI